MHLDEPSIYIYSEEDIPLIIRATDAFVKIDHKAATFHANSFYRHARFRFNEIQLPI